MLVSSTAVCLLLIICSNYIFGWDPKQDTERGKMPMFCESKGVFRTKRVLLNNKTMDERISVRF